MIALHDPELLRHSVDMLWHIHDEKITIFSGSYDDYLREAAIQRERIEYEIGRIDRERKSTHQALMKEQERASKRKAQGEKKYANGPAIILGTARDRSERTYGKNQKAIRATRDDLLEQLSELYLPEIITPKFSLTSAEIEDRVMISISAGSIGYEKEKMILLNIYFFLHSKGRIALRGKNGSGKSTFVKALLGDDALIKNGDWYVPKSKEIGYLDQHYSTLSSQQTVLESLSKLVPWPQAELRRYLNDFLFRKNEEVHRAIYQLSGGEKARLSLAHVAAKTPRLLVLDEVTNNLDLETRQHVINVLKAYPGAMIVISHDEEFLDKINVEESYDVSEWA